MKKIAYILLITALTILTQSRATHTDIKLASNGQVQYLINQAQSLAEQGIDQKDILKIFDQGLTEQELGAAKPKTGFRMIIIFTGCIVCVAIGGGITYYFINEKINEKQAEVDRLNTQNQQHQRNIANLTQQLNQAQAQAQNPLAGIAAMLQQNQAPGNPLAALMQQLQQNQAPGGQNPLEALFAQFMQLAQPAGGNQNP